MTLQEERAALVKRIEEIDAKASFKPGWYVKWDCSVYVLERIDYIKLYEMYCSLWDHVEPIHLVAHKFLPEGWKVVPPETGNLYDWSKAPDWAKYCATDVGGEVWWYDRKPVSIGDGAYLSASGGKNKEEDEESVKLRPVPWYQSLEQRPEGV